MPTGYTSDIYDGKDVSGKDFILQCSRMFLSCMRDTTLNSPLPKQIEVDNYYVEHLEKAKDKLRRVKNMTIEEIEKEVEEKYQHDIENYKKVHEAKNQLKHRYLKVLSEIILWQPPTTEHESLKKFAIDQLMGSIEQDCSTRYRDSIPVKQTPIDYYNDKIEDYTDSVQYAEDLLKSEQEHVEQQNCWLKQLRDSL